MAISLALAIVMAQAGAGGAAVSNQPHSLPMTTIDQGTLSGIDERRQIVVRTPAEWEALWREHAPERERPVVDFERSTVLAVFMGSRPTAGWSARIASVTPSAGGVDVVEAHQGPAADQVVAQILTAPFHIVSVPRFRGPATFRVAR
jgi:hypothetical protein